MSFTNCLDRIEDTDEEVEDLCDEELTFEANISRCCFNLGSRV